MTPQVQRAGPKTDSPAAVKPTTGHTAATSDSNEWRTEALRVIEVLANTGKTLDVDLVLMLTGLPPSPKHIGSVFAHARQQKIIEAVGAKVGDGGRLIRIYVRCHR